MTITISNIYVHPVKACRAISATAWPLSKCGLKYDRHWLIITSDDRKFVTQREQPKLALIKPLLDVDIFNTATSDMGGTLVLTAPGMEKELRIPIHPTPEMRSSAYPVTIWTDPVGALDAGDEAAEWLTRFLGISVRLVAKDDNSVRPVVKNAPTATEVGFQPETAFADAFPILLVSETSLADINTQLPDTSQQVTTRNFRPNIVVRGCSAPYEEETWKQVAVGAPEQEAIWHVACRCIRCSVPTIDPETGVKSADGQPQKLIQEVRRVDKGPKSKYIGCFGMNVIPSAIEGIIRVGDSVRVLATGEHMRLM